MSFAISPCKTNNLTDTSLLRHDDISEHSPFGLGLGFHNEISANSCSVMSIVKVGLGQEDEG